MVNRYMNLVLFNLLEVGLFSIRKLYNLLTMYALLNCKDCYMNTMFIHRWLENLFSTQILALTELGLGIYR